MYVHGSNVYIHVAVACLRKKHAMSKAYGSNMKMLNVVPTWRWYICHIHNVYISEFATIYTEPGAYEG